MNAFELNFNLNVESKECSYVIQFGIHIHISLKTIVLKESNRMRFNKYTHGPITCRFLSTLSTNVSFECNSLFKFAQIYSVRIPIHLFILRKSQVISYPYMLDLHWYLHMEKECIYMMKTDGNSWI